MEVLPHWPEATVAVLATGDRHQIPVSLVVRSGDRELVVGLARHRESLANLHDDPGCALTIIAPGLAFTAYGTAAAIDDADPVVAARVAVERIADHDHATFEITAGVAWEWTDDDAVRRDAAARDALRRIAP
jgi:pyruvate/2-oxoglutarate/acetoin dehydrogenase E1 component